MVWVEIESWLRKAQKEGGATRHNPIQDNDLQQRGQNKSEFVIA
jgi:hypothetical protein